MDDKAMDVNMKQKQYGRKELPRERDVPAQQPTGQTSETPQMYLVLSISCLLQERGNEKKTFGILSRSLRKMLLGKVFH